MIFDPPSDPQELQIWNFIGSRPRVTLSEVADACDASEWVRSNFLRKLQRLGLWKECGRDGRTRVYTIFAVDEANAMASGTGADLATLNPADRVKSLLSRSLDAEAQLKAAGQLPTDPEELEILKFITSVPQFLAKDLAKSCAASESKSTNFLRRMKSEGIVRKIGAENSANLYTTLHPVVAHERSKDLRETIEGKIWTAVRVSKKFGFGDLCAGLKPSLPEVTEKQVADYLKLLTRAGYIKKVAPAPLSGNGPAFQLINNSGPLPPRPHNLRVIVDENFGRIVHAPGGRL